jgi:8-oxo-dGTP pyrophosphatase MutT (NUDIX family)
MTQKYKVYINNEVKLVEENWNDFCSGFNLIEAAGGLVSNQENKVLMIFRNGKWDLPKGKLELGECIESCAIREVEEECGVSGLEICNKLLDTFHTYDLKGEKILKKTYWYNMSCSFSGDLIPQTEEGITEVCWVDMDSVKDKLSNSYSNIKDVFESL